MRRPLSSQYLSSPNDYHFLTPGQFLIGHALNALPVLSLKQENQNNLQRYMKLEQINHHVWHRWQKEYVAELQQCSKWRTKSASLEVGDLVLLQEDNVPPLSWRLGRVSHLFPSLDGVTRVADIETTRGCFWRPLTLICPCLSLRRITTQEVERSLSTGGKMSTPCTCSLFCVSAGGWPEPLITDFFTLTRTFDFSQLTISTRLLRVQ